MKNKIVELIVKSIFAGVCIAFAAMIFLYASSVSLDESISKAVCSLLFGFGLYFIIVMEYKLFTGMVAGLTDMKVKEYYTLIICYVFNTLGILVICVLLFLMNNPMSNAVISRAGAVMANKLKPGYGSAFISAIFCGMMITLAVKANRVAAGKGLAGALAIIFPVVMFVYLGFEHCIANQAYIFLAILGGEELSLGSVLAFAIITALGNILGGVCFPLMKKLFEKNPQELSTVTAEEKVDKA